MKKRNCPVQKTKVWRFIIAAIIAAIFLFCTFVIYAYRKEKEALTHPMGVQPFSLRSAEIYISGEWLYYCDPERNGGFYVYNLETGEEIEIEKQEGIPYKTSHGFFYILGGEESASVIYEVQGFGLSYLCKLPKNADFVDCVNGKIYWTARRQVKESWLRQYFYSWDMGLEELSDISSSLLYDISSGSAHIDDIAILEEKVYIGQSDGLYVLERNTMVTDCILQKHIRSVKSEGEYVWFVGEQEDFSNWIYLVYPEDNKIQKMEASASATFCTMKEGILYYNDSVQIRAFDSASGKNKLMPATDSTLIHQAYTKVAFVQNYMVLRHGYDYYICLYNMQTGTMERILPEG